MTVTKLEESMKQVAQFYFIALKQLRLDKISSGEEDLYSPFYKYYQDVELAFSKISPEKQRLITKEFFYDAYKGWWVDYYRPAEFKKLKKSSIKEFLEAFYEIH